MEERDRFAQLEVAFILLSSIPTSVGCTGFMQTEHRAQFYINDGYLCEAPAQFVAAGLRDGGSIVVITSTLRRDSIASHLLTHGFDLTPLGDSGKASVCDARAAGAVHGRRRPRPRPFHDGAVVAARSLQGGRRSHRPCLRRHGRGPLPRR